MELVYRLLPLLLHVFWLLYTLGTSIGSSIHPSLEQNSTISSVTSSHDIKHVINETNDVSDDSSTQGRSAIAEAETQERGAMLEDGKTNMKNVSSPLPTQASSIGHYSPGGKRELPCSLLYNLREYNSFYVYTNTELRLLLCRCSGTNDTKNRNRTCSSFLTMGSEDVIREVHNDKFDPLSDRNLPKFIAVIIVFAFLLILGLIGNILTIVGILRWVKTASSTFAFVVSLSLSDLLLLCVCMPLKATQYFYLQAVFTALTCKLSCYLRNVTLISSVFTMTVISFERYYAICHPLVVQYRCTWRRARVIIVITWFVSCCLAIPTIPMTKLYTSAAHPGYMRFCQEQSDSMTVLRLYYIYLGGVLFAVPMAIMVFTYGRSCHALWKSAQVSKQLQGRDRIGDRLKGCLPSSKESNDIRSRQQVIRVLIYMAISFCLCWGSRTVAQYLMVVRQLPFILVDAPTTSLLLESLTYISSVLNPYLFMAMSSQFRQALSRVARSISDRYPDSSRRETSMKTEMSDHHEQYLEMRRHTYRGVRVSIESS